LNILFKEEEKKKKFDKPKKKENFYDLSFHNPSKPFISYPF
jgi:hypothetical protein